MASRPPGRGRWLAVLAAALGLALGPSGCANGSVDAAQPIVQDVALGTLEPGVLVPGTRIVLEGSSFMPDFVGPSLLRLHGTLDGADADIGLPASFLDYDRMSVVWPGGRAAGLPADQGLLAGVAYVETRSSVDGLVHQSAPIAVGLAVVAVLAPRLDQIDNQVLFVNDPVLVHGDGFLLGGEEGQSVAIVQGCFTPNGQPSCLPVGPAEVVAGPYQNPYDRSVAVFPFAPAIAGILPGSFTGTVSIENRQGGLGGWAVTDSDSVPTANELVEPAIFAFDPPHGSLGQYLDVQGGGFVGSAPGDPDPTLGLTTVELDGALDVAGAPAPTPVTLTLVPEFESGRLVRYVLNEEDELGHNLDLRNDTATFTGTARPVVQYGSDTVQGSAWNVSLGIDPVKQVVWLRFLPAYVESLRHFGLRAADQRIRDRVLEVVRRDYTAVNLEWRTTEPSDFALYSVVEIAGPDPNGLGLLGYDNTTGKDSGNLRLFDQIGGVNALTQADGYPGYGGVFMDSLFTYSTHPGAWLAEPEAPEPLFDQLFDPFRPDVQNAPVAAAELGSGGVPVLGSGDPCPAADRPTQIACAVWALGSLVGTTTSHELGHSLGLADPWGPAIHNSGDYPNALMDAGSARPFAERAELQGQGPGVFCLSQFQYLQQILPTSLPDPLPNRLECY